MCECECVSVCEFVVPDSRGVEDWGFQSGCGMHAPPGVYVYVCMCMYVYVCVCVRM